MTFAVPTTSQTHVQFTDLPDDIFGKVIGSIFPDHDAITDSQKSSSTYQKLFLTSKTSAEKLQRISQQVQSLCDKNFFAKYFSGALNTDKMTDKSFKAFLQQLQYHAQFTQCLFPVPLRNLERDKERIMKIFTMSQLSSLREIDVSRYWILTNNQLQNLFSRNAQLETISLGSIRDVTVGANNLYFARSDDTTEKNRFICLNEKLIKQIELEGRAFTVEKIHTILSKCSSLTAIVILSKIELSSLDFSNTKIEEINLRICNSTIHIFSLPSTLKRLILPAKTQKLPDLLHTQLELLDADLCMQLTEIPPLPSTLKRLELPESIQKLPDLLQTQLEKLGAKYSTQLKEIPPLPSTLKRLELPESIQKLPDLSNTQLEELDADLCTQLTEISSLPSTLKRLFLPKTIQKLPDLSNTQLEELYICLCLKLTETPPLPSTLGSLSLPSSLEQFPDLSNTQLEKLDISSCTRLIEIPLLPSTLIRLFLPESIQKLSDLSNTQLVGLDISSCTQLTEIPPLPSTLKRLTLPEKIQKLQNQMEKLKI